MKAELLRIVGGTEKHAFGVVDGVWSGSSVMKKMNRKQDGGRDDDCKGFGELRLSARQDASMLDKVKGDDP